MAVSKLMCPVPHDRIVFHTCHGQFFAAQHKFFQFLPVLLQIALEISLPRVTETEMETLAGHLKKPRDKREGQILAIFDRLFKLLEEGITTHGLRRPLLFEGEGIDRRCLTAFNTNIEVRVKEIMQII